MLHNLYTIRITVFKAKLKKSIELVTSKQKIHECISGLIIRGIKGTMINPTEKFFCINIL